MKVTVLPANLLIYPMQNLIQCPAELQCPNVLLNTIMSSSIRHFISSGWQITGLEQYTVEPEVIDYLGKGERS